MSGRFSCVITTVTSSATAKWLLVGRPASMKYTVCGGASGEGFTFAPYFSREYTALFAS